MSDMSELKSSVQDIQKKVQELVDESHSITSLVGGVLGTISNFAGEVQLPMAIMQFIQRLGKTNRRFVPLAR